MSRRKRNLKISEQSGQAVLVILLLMAIASTIGLIMSRNVTTDLQMTKIQEESTRAFSAAEAGIEAELYNWRTGGTTAPSLEGVDITTVTESWGENQTSLATQVVKDGSFAVVWLTDHNEDGTFNTATRSFVDNSIDLCWEEGAGVELVLFYKDVAGEYKTQRWAFDSDAAGHGNNFDSPDIMNCSQSTEFSSPVGKNIGLPGAPAIPLFVVAKVYYANSRIGAEAAGGGLFSSRGIKITSTGTVTSGDGRVVSRRLRIFQTWDLPPFVFLEPLFSSGLLRTQK